MNTTAAQFIKFITFAALVSGAALNTQAATSSERAAQLCKAEALAQFGSAEQPVRVKFKGISGHRKSPVVTLKVLPAGADSYRAVCEADAKNGVVTNLNVIQ